MRYTGPKLKILRRFNLIIQPALTQKFQPPESNDDKLIAKNMVQSESKNRKQSLYSIRLIEKQKLRFNYGLTNNQLLNYVKRAQKRSGSTGENLIKFLESRFDNIIFRLNLAPTINAARQLILHGHFEINKKKVTIPSYECCIKDEISITAKSKNLVLKNATRAPLKKEKKERIIVFNKEKKLPNYLLWDEKRSVGTISQEISLKDPIVQQYIKLLRLRILYVLEYYSRQL
uniref:ribosomal protein S4 n=1 Tax=Cephaleuros parasiticus TaxID=173370 RepID=UPI001EDE990F|nr:ribosomal protein S4 [Cephaleuros parasiticus]UIB38993.1 ribosomal protein S4 [Cephaleuros parasiticus]